MGRKGTHHLERRMTAKLWPHPDRHKYVIQGAPYTWQGDGTETPGVGLILPPRYLVQYLTAEQALTLADQLVDAAENVFNQTKETP
jgi:hypothetical protein